MNPFRPVQVYLVGAGPGDPGLLTRRGAEVLGRADVVLYDNLSNPALLALAPAGAERRYVGKKPRSGKTDQEGINRALVAEALAGRVVVRLKGGDGYVFGRGGEEALALAEAGVPFEVVPGVSSAVAGPAAAGIPITHRGLASSFHVAVGFEDPDDPACSVPWERIGALGGTVVVMMASHHIGRILARLHAGGMPGDTPAATVRDATRADQRTLRATLAEAVADPSRLHLPPPAITIVGAVAGFGESLAWFERRPLFGRRVLLTRPTESDDAIAAALREAGADVETHPAVARAHLPDPGGAALAEALEWAREGRGWLVPPSPTAIDAMFARMGEAGLDARALAGLRVAVVGEGSARRLAARGVRADFVAPRGDGRSLAEALPVAADCERALVAGSAIGRPELRDGLAARGLEVRHRPLYDTIPDPAGLAALGERLEEADAATAAIVFSPSAARAIGDALPAAAIARTRWIAIGGTTAEAMRSAGFPEPAVCERPTAESVAAAVGAIALGRP